jgi:hypothetical protein
LSFFSHKGPGFVGLHPLGPYVADLLIVKRLSMFAGADGNAQDRIQTHATQPGRRPHAIAFDDVFGNRDDLVLRQLCSKEGGTGPLGETLVADGTAEAANVAGFTRPAVGPD